MRSITTFFKGKMAATVFVYWFHCFDILKDLLLHNSFSVGFIVSINRSSLKETLFQHLFLESKRNEEKRMQR